MSALMDLVEQHLAAKHVDQITSRLGASREQTESAIGMALPALLGAVACKADDGNAAQELHQSLQENNGKVLDQLDSLLSGNNGQTTSVETTQSVAAGDLLRNIFGSRQARVEQGIGKASGMNASQVALLLNMLAPIVMAAIAKQSNSGNLDLSGLIALLRTEKKSMENQASGGLLAGLLDQDGDGDFDVQDMTQLGMKRLFGRK